MAASAPARVTLGPFDVAAEASALVRFPGADRAAGTVPATFPIVWLAHPAIRAAIEGFARPGEVAFHEEQVFDYRAALEAGQRYGLTVDIERQETPARIALSGRLERQGGTVLAMRTLLRLIDGTPVLQPAQAGAAQQ